MQTAVREENIIGGEAPFAQQLFGVCVLWCFLFYFSRKVSLKGNMLKMIYACIPALWEAEVGESRSQEIENMLANMVKPHLYKNIKN